MVSAAPITGHQVVSREEWLAARKEHLADEKRLTRLRDQLSAERRALPWVKVDKEYLFEGPDGPVTLADLFNGKSQLILNHFMFGPEWEEGCLGCSFKADHLDGALLHITQRDIAFVNVSRAPLPKLMAFKERMGWNFRWVSSYGSDFNSDYHVSYTEEDRAAGRPWLINFEERAAPEGDEEESGISVFYKDEQGVIYHTYSSFIRGDEAMMTSYSLIDLTPIGRNETHGLAEWVHLHDRYETDGMSADSSSDCGCHERSA